MNKNRKMVNSNCTAKKSIPFCNQPKNRFPLKPQRRISAVNAQTNNVNLIKMGNALKAMQATVAALQRENAELKAKQQGKA
jgi:hypothetical protein